MPHSRLRDMPARTHLPSKTSGTGRSQPTQPLESPEWGKPRPESTHAPDHTETALLLLDPSASASGGRGLGGRCNPGARPVRPLASCFLSHRTPNLTTGHTSAGSAVAHTPRWLPAPAPHLPSHTPPSPKETQGIHIGSGDPAEFSHSSFRRLRRGFPSASADLHLRGETPTPAQFSHAFIKALLALSN